MEKRFVTSGLVDAIGNPLRFLLTPGQVHDLVGADALLPQIAADVLIADKAFDADDRVIRPLAAAGKSAVIPPRRRRLTPRAFDQDLYKARHEQRQDSDGRRTRVAGGN